MVIALTSHCSWASVRISRYSSPPCPPADDHTSEARGVPLWHLCWRMKFDRDARIGGSHGSPYSMLFAIASAIIMGISPPWPGTRICTKEQLYRRDRVFLSSLMESRRLACFVLVSHSVEGSRHARSTSSKHDSESVMFPTAHGSSVGGFAPYSRSQLRRVFHR